jgi:antitoxin component of RelBE/YafQ-DinJ toxin-antitoxin module
VLVLRNEAARVKPKDDGVLESVSQKASDALRMFIAHFAKEKADGRIPMEINVHNGILKCVWVSGIRFEIPDKNAN